MTWAYPVRSAIAATLLCGALPACSPRTDDTAALPADDQRQLNEAAAALDSNSVDPHPAGAHESSPHD